MVDAWGMTLTLAFRREEVRAFNVTLVGMHLVERPLPFGEELGALSAMVGIAGTLERATAFAAGGETGKGGYVGSSGAMTCLLAFAKTDSLLIFRLRFKSLQCFVGEHFRDRRTSA